MSAALLLNRHLSSIAERSPRLYRLALIAKHRNRAFLRRIVSPEHDLVIEGFPRSANSFAVRAFLFANGWRDPRVATHVHSPAQVALAAEWSIPTILCIRPPEQAVVSWMAYAHMQGQLAGAAPGRGLPRRWIRAQIARYARFHESTTPLSDHYVLAPFEQITQDFGAVIARVNRKFGRDFEVFEHRAEHVGQIMRTSRSHLGPDRRRSELKATYAELYAAPDLDALRKRARAAYDAAMAASTGDMAAVPSPADDVSRTVRESPGWAWP